MNVRFVRRYSFAFTLCELLVALSILAILAAILLPVFTRVKEKAVEPLDLSQLRYIGFADLQYEQDNNGYIVPSSVNFNDTNVYDWRGLLSPYMRNTNPEPTTIPNPFYDPQDITPFPLSNPISYALNSFVSGDYTLTNTYGPQYAQPSLRINQIKRESEVIFAGDSNHVYPAGWGGASTGFTLNNWVAPADINGLFDGFGVAEAPGCVHSGESTYTDACVKWIKPWLIEDHHTAFDPSQAGTLASNCLKNDGTPHSDTWACTAPDFRHNRQGMYTGFANFVYLDGHTGTTRFGKLNTWNFIPNETAAQRAF